MILFPAIDLYEGCAVRLLRGEYDRMTVYSREPERIAENFAAAGATHIHLVDLEGARSGQTPNLETVCRIREKTGLFAEIGGGIRTMETVEKYIRSGLDRVILGTAAVTDETFLQRALERYGEKIAVGADIKDGFVAIRGWTETSGLTCGEFFAKMEKLGVATVIVTDVSRDGAMQGTNRPMYQALSQKYRVQITASGGVSSLEDVRALKEMGLYGAIIGKAYYEGAIQLKEAVEAAR